MLPRTRKHTVGVVSSRGHCLDWAIHIYLSTDFPHFTDECLEQRALRNASDRVQDYRLNSL